MMAAAAGRARLIQSNMIAPEVFQAKVSRVLERVLIGLASSDPFKRGRPGVRDV